MEESEARLQPGVAFHLEPGGQWKPEKIPPAVIEEAKFSGYLTIQGYRCTVFETPDKNQWAQKSTGTLAEAPEPTTASKIAEQWLKSHGAKPPETVPMRGIVVSRVASTIAARWLQAQDDITSLVQKKLDRDGDDKDYDKAIVDFVTKTRGKLPPIDTALARACDVLMKTREKVEHAHPKVQDRYVQMFLQELAEKQRELEDMRKQLMRGLTVELDRYEAEANQIPEGHPDA
jgi:hypothetical protein